MCLARLVVAVAFCSSLVIASDDRFARDVTLEIHPDTSIVALFDGEKNFVATCVRLNSKHALCYKSAIPKSLQKSSKYSVVANGLSDLRTVTPENLVPVVKFFNLNKCGTRDMVLLRTNDMVNGTDAMLPSKLIPQGLDIVPYHYDDGQISPNDGSVHLKTLPKYSCPSYFRNHHKFQFCAKWASTPSNLNYTGAPVVYRANGFTTATGFAILPEKTISGVELFVDIFPCVRDIQNKIRPRKTSSSENSSSSSDE